MATVIIEMQTIMWEEGVLFFSVDCLIALNLWRLALCRRVNDLIQEECWFG